jgi:uncharacterized membrane protein YoaK (UPF0700 family)
MFIYKGKSRSSQQNLAIASLLAFVAGIVNVTGLLAVQRLTTNVTGHFAFMVEEGLNYQFNQAWLYLVFVFMFLFGAFFSNVIIEIMNKVTDKFIFIIPVIIEAGLLATIAFFDYGKLISNPNFTACVLLFAMGMQNSMVTTISNAVVRTTHLTGLFTDLGIELSQLLFYRSAGARQTLFASIKLRLTIILTFFLGGIIAGLVFPALYMKTLFIGSAVLLGGVFLDYMVIRIKLRISE